jgi:hypothetical protein
MMLGAQGGNVPLNLNQDLSHLATDEQQRRPPNNPFATHSFTPADRGDLAANQRTAFKKKNRDTYSEGSNDEKTVSQELFKTPMN